MSISTYNPFIDLPADDDQPGGVIRTGGGKRSLSVQFKTENFDQADATLQLQQSNNGEDWIDEGSAVTIGSGDDDNIIDVEIPTAKFYRVNFAHGTNATGTINAWIN